MIMLHGISLCSKYRIVFPQIIYIDWPLDVPPGDFHRDSDHSYYGDYNSIEIYASKRLEGVSFRITIKGV